jgi:signal transduction histidine kinase
LAKGAARIGAGDLETEIEVESADEIGLLAAQMNQMRQSILKRDEHLQMMLAGVAHEVRNPLGGMLLFLNLLREEIRNPEQALQHADRIGKELTYLNLVVTDFLDFARNKALAKEKIDPKREFEHLRDLMQLELESKSLTMEISVSENIPQVRWDRERMRQALLNLLRNAVQASHEGGTIQLQLSHRDSQWSISVTDWGKGIPPRQQDQIFEPFFTTRQKGTGLGLALVKKIVDAHRGRVSFASSTETGTRFEILLPGEGESD